MTTKSELLFASINDFYSDPGNQETLMNVLHKRNGSPSLRSIEWFITNYARKNLTNYQTKDGKIFTVHCAYKSTLNGFSKRFFDPFCRSSKISYTIPGTEVEIQTTLAQLNFIRWVIRSGILTYMENNRRMLFSK
jgi:hypothetical protein